MKAPSLMMPIVIAASLLAIPAFAQSAKATLVKAENEIRELAKEKTASGEARIQAIVDRLVDLDSVAKRALGNHWAKIPKDQREELRGLVRRFVRAAYRKRLAGGTGDDAVTIHWGAESAAGSTTNVAAKGTSGDDEVELEFQMEKHGDAWRVADVRTDDVSMVDTYKKQFHRIIKQKGVDALIARLKKQIAKLEKG